VARYEPAFYVRALPEGPVDRRASHAERLNLSDRVLSYEFQDKERGADILKLTVDNNDLSNFDDPVWKTGMVLETSFGFVGNMSVARLVKVRKVTGLTTLTIEAHGFEVVMNRQVKSRTFENMTRSQIVEQIAREAGFDESEILHIESTEVVLPVIHQARLTDAQFIRRLAHKEGFEWYVDFDGFHFHQRDVTQRPFKEYNWFLDPDDSNFEVISIENDATAKPGAHRVKGRNPLEHSDIDEHADNDTEADRGVLADTLEVVDGETGLTREVVMNERVEPTTQEDAALAKREVSGKFRKTQQMAIKMKVNAEGNPLQLAKTVVSVTGLGRRLSQKYYVRSVTHKIAGEYKMDMEWVSDGSGGHSTESTIADGLSRFDEPVKANGKRGPDAEAVEKDSDGGLEPVEVVDGETGGTRIVYLPSSRREPAAAPDAAGIQQRSDDAARQFEALQEGSE